MTELFGQGLALGHYLALGAALFCISPSASRFRRR